MNAEHVDAAAAQSLHIKRHQRDDHQQADHVDERRDHQREKLRWNLAYFFVKNVEQSYRDRAQQHPDNRRLEGLGNVALK
jgi:hypothetical protein